jgi:recombination protein RecT
MCSRRAIDGDARSHARGASPTRRPAADAAIAAIRESFEELGILLARYADGRPAGAQDIAP